MASGPPVRRGEPAHVAVDNRTSGGPAPILVAVPSDGPLSSAAVRRARCSKGDCLDHQYTQQRILQTYCGVYFVFSRPPCPFWWSRLRVQVAQASEPGPWPPPASDTRSLLERNPAERQGCRSPVRSIPTRSSVVAWLSPRLTEQGHEMLRDSQQESSRLAPARREFLEAIEEL